MGGIANPSPAHSQHVLRRRLGLVALMAEGVEWLFIPPQNLSHGQDRTHSVLSDDHSDKHRMFSAVKYRGVDYVYEASARQRLTVNWLVVPVPQHLDQIDQYSYKGSLPDDTYRKPWTRGSVLSTCKLIISGSILNDWMACGYPTDVQEKFTVTQALVKSGAEDMVPSSNPNSQADTDIDEVPFLPGKDGYSIPWKESFSRFSRDSESFRQWNEDLFVQEDVVFTDCLAEFRRQIPKLFSRLRILSVQDPLLNVTGDVFREDMFFRYHVPLDEIVIADAEGSDLQNEDFSKVTVLSVESLMLPFELDYKTLQQKSSALPIRELCDSLRISPESLVDEMTCLETLTPDESAEFRSALEVSEYDRSSGADSVVFMESTVSTLGDTTPVRSRLYTQMETDPPLSPVCQTPQPAARGSCRELTAEQLSPIYRHHLISDSDREGIEGVLWQAEKHISSLIGLLLAEPQTPEPELQYRIAAETFGLIADETDCSINEELRRDDHKQLTLNVGQSRFVENLGTTSYDTTEKSTSTSEDFSLLSMIEIDNILKDCSNETECPVAAVTHSETKVRSILKDSNQKHMTPEKDKGRTLKVSITEAAIDKPSQKRELASSERCEPSKMALSLQESNSDHCAYAQHTGDHKFFSKDAKNSCNSGTASKSQQENLDPLATFIMLRSKQLPEGTSAVHSTQCKSQNNTAPKVEVKPLCAAPADSSSDEKTRHSAVIEIQASESQCQAYCQLQDVASTFISSAKELGMCTAARGSFSTLTSDQTRFFLKQQEKVLNSSLKQGEPSETDVSLYKQAALVHLLVTVRDLLLMCDLNTAVDYLVHAKETYVSTLGTCLDEIWSRLRVVQYISQKKEEANPKIAELQQQTLAWIQRNSSPNQSPKVLVIIRMDSDCVRALLIKNLNKVKGLSAAAVFPEEKSRLNCRVVLNCLQQSSCVVACSQHIHADFPWQQFSLVVEYDYMDHSGWTALCREKNISHMALKIQIPSTVSTNAVSQNGSSSLLLDLGVPVVLLTTEGLSDSPELLQTLESRYNITVVERSFVQSLQMFGGPHQYTVITVDERTALVIQDIGELKMDKASDHIVLRLMALSLQYSCCWLLFYSSHGLDSEYSFTTEVFNNLVLIYAAVVLFGLKTEDLEIKVLIAPGVEKTAMLICQIASHTLMSSEIDPLKWLDRSWLSVVPTEAESSLLAFPCINPLVAQLMLRKAPSLDWLLGASFTELQELLPEVPHKVIKLFSDTTALYKMNVSHSPLESCGKATSREYSPCSGPRPVSREDTQGWIEVLEKNQGMNSEHHPLSGSVSVENMAVYRKDHEPFPIPEETEGTVQLGHFRDLSHPPLHVHSAEGHWQLGRIKDSDLTSMGEYCGVHFNSKPAGHHHSNWTSGRPIQAEAFSPAYDKDLSFNMGPSIDCQFEREAVDYYCHQKSNSPGEVSQFGVGFNEDPCLFTSSVSAGMLQGSSISPFGHTPRVMADSVFSFIKTGYETDVSDNSDLLGPLRSTSDKKRRAGRADEKEAFSGYTLLPQLKRRKLTYEKVPGRIDGQTRLAFF
ncbi:protein shortage in chiasmata 1 ortholog isoform X2 [Lepisosteus oculatus]|uniref:protein shortage in chiasmata 1 ortholog isoform X2 n=1 Tax=Lepisosteus oculatus TaxID=7918 RepID=UPI0037180CB0